MPRQVKAGSSLFDVDKNFQDSFTRTARESALVTRLCDVFNVPAAIRRETSQREVSLSFPGLLQTLNLYGTSYPSCFSDFEVYHLKDTEKKFFTLSSLLSAPTVLKKWPDVLCGIKIGLFPNVFTTRQLETGLVITTQYFKDVDIWEVSGGVLTLSLTENYLRSCGIKGDLDVEPNTHLCVYSYETYLNVIRLRYGSLFPVD